MLERYQASMMSSMAEVASVNAATDLRCREESSTGLRSADCDGRCGVSAQFTIDTAAKTIYINFV